MNRRILLATALFILATLLAAHCTSIAGEPMVLQRELATAALTAHTTGDRTLPLDVELFRTRVRADAGETRVVDVALVRDPRSGVTLRQIVSIGDRPFMGVQAAVQSSNAVRFVERDDRLFAFSVFGDMIRISEFADRYSSMEVAETAAVQWLLREPQVSDPNRLDFGRVVSFSKQVGSMFFADPSTREPKAVLLRDVKREGDHWLVTIEGPSHPIVTLVIDDRDQLVEVRRETGQGSR